MADTTANLSLPFILPSQAQKHVTHNEALAVIDAVVHLTIAGERAAPPPSPVAGSRYLVAASPTAAWIGRQTQIAVWDENHWDFLTPRDGWRAWFSTENEMRVLTGGAWQALPLPETGHFDRLGIAAVADATNRLSVSAAASLFSHSGSGHQIKINKAAAADTASLLFQTSWTGFAEMGLAGNNAFSIKVSDGTSWKTGLSISAAGHVSRPNQPALRAYRTGTSFSPTAGQQSGFTTAAVSQGGFTFGAAAPGGGNRIVVPAAGLYLICLNVAVLTSSGHATTLMLNGNQVLASLSGPSGGAQMQSSTGIFSLAAGDYLTLGHAGTAQIELGNGRTEISITLI